MAQRKQYKTAKGKTFDMERFVQSQKDTVAVGNLGGNKPTNASGDILGKGGKIEVKREEVVRQYYREEPPKTKQTSIKEPFSTGPTVEKDIVFKSPDEALKELVESSHEKEEIEKTTTTSTRRRKKSNEND